MSTSTTEIVCAGELQAIGPTTLGKPVPVWQPGQVAAQYVHGKRGSHKKRT